MAVLEDRVSAKPGRMLIKPEDGSEFYATLEMADEPVTPGNKINRQNVIDTAKKAILQSGGSLNVSILKITKSAKVILPKSASNFYQFLFCGAGSQAEGSSGASIGYVAGVMPDNCELDIVIGETSESEVGGDTSITRGDITAIAYGAQLRTDTTGGSPLAAVIPSGFMLEEWTKIEGGGGGGGGKGADYYNYDTFIAGSAGGAGGAFGGGGGGGGGTSYPDAEREQRHGAAGGAAGVFGSAGGGGGGGAAGERATSYTKTADGGAGGIAGATSAYGGAAGNGGAGGGISKGTFEAGKAGEAGALLQSANNPLYQVTGNVFPFWALRGSIEMNSDLAAGGVPGAGGTATIDNAKQIGGGTGGGGGGGSTYHGKGGDGATGYDIEEGSYSSWARLVGGGGGGGGGSGVHSNGAAGARGSSQVYLSSVKRSVGGAGGGGGGLFSDATGTIGGGLFEYGTNKANGVVYVVYYNFV